MYNFTFYYLFFIFFYYYFLLFFTAFLSSGGGSTFSNWAMHRQFFAKSVPFTAYLTSNEKEIIIMFFCNENTFKNIQSLHEFRY